MGLTRRALLLDTGKGLGVALLVACQSAAPTGSGTPAAAPSPAAAPTKAAPSGGSASAGSPTPAARPAAAPSQAASPVAGAGSVTQIKIGVTGSIADAPLYIAQARGYFKEAGVATNLTPLDSAARMVPFLSTGDLQVGGGAPSVGLFAAVQRNIQLRIVADRVQSMPNAPADFFVVRKGLADQIKTFADLKGRKIAVTALGSTIYVDAVKALAMGGLKPSDADIVQLGFPDMAAALAGGSVDVIIVAEPFRTVAVRQGGVVWKTSQDINPGEEASVLIYSPKFIANQSDLASKFMVAYVRAVRDAYQAFIAKNPQARTSTIDLLSQVTPVKDKNVWETSIPSGIDPNGRVNEKGITDLISFFVNDHELPNAQGLQGIVDNRYVDAAVKQLGPAPAATP